MQTGTRYLAFYKVETGIDIDRRKMAGAKREEGEKVEKQSSGGGDEKT